MTFKFEGYNVPIDIAKRCAINEHNFGEGRVQVNYFKGVVGIQPNHHVLEIGSAVGRIAIPLSELIMREGSYTGVDIVWPAVEWCSNNIANTHPHFQFSHLDVKDEHHNPGGCLRTVDTKLPLPDDSMDRIIVWLVFTHLFAEDIEHYLREFCRVLKFDGLAIISCHLVNDELLRRLQEDGERLTFEHEHSSGCYINYPEHPWLEVAYTEDKMYEMISASGLEYDRPLLPGPSRAVPSRNFYASGLNQDVIVLRRANRGNQSTHP